MANYPPQAKDQQLGAERWSCARAPPRIGGVQADALAAHLPRVGQVAQVHARDPAGGPPSYGSYQP